MNNDMKENVMTENETVMERLNDLLHGTEAVVAFHFGDRDGVVEALRMVTPNRVGDALLAVATLGIDQAARALGVPWESVADLLMAATIDPDEEDAVRRRIKEQ